MAAAVAYPEFRVSHAARSSYSSSMGSHYIPNSSLRSMTPTKNHPRSTNANSSYPMSTLYIKYVRRVWKRFSRATRKPERASVLPDGFVLINNARLNTAARRKSIMLA